MLLPFNQIINNALIFSNKWQNETNENAEAKTFWNEFFEIFGLSRKRIGSFEQAVTLHNGKKGYIDFFWKGTLIIEHKSKGKNLDKAFKQAIDYFPGLKEEDLPRYVITSDFQRIRVYDLLEINHVIEIPLCELHKNIHVFDFITNFRANAYEEDEEITVKAGLIIGKLYKCLLTNNYNKNDLSILIIRLLFCLFADHTEIWIKNTFKEYITTQTKIDGTDMGSQLNLIFEILDTPDEKRQKNLLPLLASFSYINGGLFRHKLSTPSFTKESRQLLIDCCKFTWDKISPSIIGSIFQSVMSEQEKKENGVHYTSEDDILKVIKPLFLDSFFNKFEKNKYKIKNLEKLLRDISKIKILDPACGCGNFLIISYKKLRILQLDIIKQIKLMNAFKNYDPHFQLDLGIPNLTLDVDAMYGFDIDDFATQIAKVALWLEDHKLNLKYSLILGCNSDRIPLKSTPKIFNVNALTVDWNDYIVKDSNTYIVGNPPFVPSNKRNQTQCNEMDLVFKANNYKTYKKLDYVSSWYVKAAEFIKDTTITCSFVSTSSIVEGEQVALLWEPLQLRGIKINFAHKSFKWSNGLSKDASVFVVIVGFSFMNIKEKKLFSTNGDGTQTLTLCDNINAYLMPKPNFFVKAAKTPISGPLIPVATKGSMPNDSGHLIIEANHYPHIPNVEHFIKPFITAKEMLNNVDRWCLWLENVEIEEFKNIKFITDRISLVRKYRSDLYNKTHKSNILKALTFPYLFENRKQPKCNYIAIPRHNITRRKYIPMKICTSSEIIGDSCTAVHTDDKFILGILMSTMHMCWVKEFSGKLKEDYRYSNTLCYNTFPFPKVTESQKDKIRNIVQSILNIRDSYTNCSLAELYDSNYNREDLVKAHIKLDKAVDKLYDFKDFYNSQARMELLLIEYNSYIK